MADTKTVAAPPPEGSAVTIGAMLVPAAAGDARDALLAAIYAAGRTGAPLTLDLAGAPALPCALQLLAAAGLSAARAGVTVQHGPAAAAALHLFSETPARE